MFLCVLKSDPESVMLDLIRGYASNLRGILNTAELYQQNPTSKDLLQRAIDILQEV